MEGWYGFPILEGECYKGNFDIHLRDSGGEGGNGFGNRFSWCQGNHHSSWGAHTRQGIIVCRVRTGCWFMA